MNVKCPNCAQEFGIKAVAQALKEQSLWFSIKYKGDLLQAATVWDTIKNFEGLMKSGAKDMGAKATTYVRSITNKDHELKVEFIVMTDVPEFPQKMLKGLKAIKNL